MNQAPSNLPQYVADALATFRNINLSKGAREQALGVVRRYEAQTGVTLQGPVNGSRIDAV